jgi:periplasmic divalent cation tolerance protein
MAARRTFVAVVTTVDGRARAAKLARRIVEARLAACVQFFPIHSLYRWKGKVESAAEWMLLAKTKRELASELIAFIRRHHTYEVPEIVVTPITGGLRAYLDWIGAETKTPAKLTPTARLG